MRLTTHHFAERSLFELLEQTGDSLGTGCQGKSSAHVIRRQKSSKQLHRQREFDEGGIVRTWREMAIQC